MKWAQNSRTTLVSVRQSLLELKALQGGRLRAHTQELLDEVTEELKRRDDAPKRQEDVS